MSWGIFFAAIHHLAAFLITGALVTEWITLRNNQEKPSFKTLFKAEMVYAVFSIMLILVGLLRVCYFEKGIEFYVSNLFFWIKIAAFGVMGILSLYPTATFFKLAKEKAT
jgi:putative membrane protein